MNILERIEMYMNAGHDEDSASRMAAYDFDPENYYTNEYDSSDEYFENQ